MKLFNTVSFSITIVNAQLHKKTIFWGKTAVSYREIQIPDYIPTITYYEETELCMLVADTRSH